MPLLLLLRRKPDGGDRTHELLFWFYREHDHMHAFDHVSGQFDHTLPHPFFVAGRSRCFIPPEALWKLDQHFCHREQCTECFGCSLLEPAALGHISIDEHSPLDSACLATYGSSTHVEDYLTRIRCLHQHVAGSRAREELTGEHASQRTALLWE